MRTFFCPSQIRPTPSAARAAAAAASGQQGGSGPASNAAAAAATASALSAAGLASKLELELGMQSENVSQVSEEPGMEL